MSIPRPVIVHTGLTAARPASGAAVSDRSNLPRLPLAPRIARLEPISLFTTALPSHRDSTAQFERHCTGTRSCSHRTLTRSKSVPGVDSRYHERDRLESQLAAMNPPLKFACASCVHRVLPVELFWHSARLGGGLLHSSGLPVRSSYGCAFVRDGVEEEYEKAKECRVAYPVRVLPSSSVHNGVAG